MPKVSTALLARAQESRPNPEAEAALAANNDVTSADTPSTAQGVTQPGSPFAEYALGLVARGYAVHPLRVNDKRPALDGWKTKATTDPAQVTTWAKAHPRHNVGVVAKACGVLGVDLDVKNNPDVLAEWAALSAGWPAGAEVTTPSGGRHIYYRTEAGHHLTDRDGWRPGIDIRAEGNLVAPGSVIGGKRYVGALPPVSELPPVPQGLVDLLSVSEGPSVAAERVSTPAPLGEAGLDAAVDGEFKRVRAAKPGERNRALNVAAYSLGQLAGGLDEDNIRERLLAAYAEVNPDDDCAEQTFESGWEAGRANPRPVTDIEPGTPDPETDPDGFAQAVQAEIRKTKIREEAHRQLAIEKLDGLPSFEIRDLDDLAALPPEPVNRIDQLMPWAADTALVAMHKAGKTTTCLNLCHSLTTGRPMFDRYEIRPLEGRVAYLDYELSEQMFGRWARNLPDLDPRRVLHVAMRGRANPLALIGTWNGEGSEPQLDRLAQTLRSREVEAVIVDPFGSAFSGAGGDQNKADQVRPWLDGLSRWVRSAVGATELVLPVHAGWQTEGVKTRARGSSALGDWPTTTWTLSYDEDTHARSFEARGRDVDVAEDTLAMDPETKLLTMTGQGSLKEAKRATQAQAHGDALLALIEAEPGLGVRELRRRAKDTLGIGNGTMDAVLGALTSEGRVTTVSGPGNSKLHYPSGRVPMV